jgi:hypothetical protein
MLFRCLLLCRHRLSPFYSVPGMRSKAQRLHRFSEVKPFCLILCTMLLLILLSRIEENILPIIRPMGLCLFLYLDTYNLCMFHRAHSGGLPLLLSMFYFGGPFPFFFDFLRQGVHAVRGWRALFEFRNSWGKIHTCTLLHYFDLCHYT